ncbi:MAG: hypothetical protein IJ899_05180 [Blautia sp.]|nr:hypothetical protein [Blautia sp.]
MAGRIQGITVEIGGDTTKLSSALQGVNKEIKSGVKCSASFFAFQPYFFYSPITYKR